MNKTGHGKLKFQKASWLPHLMGSRKHLSSTSKNDNTEDDFEFDEEDFAMDTTTKPTRLATNPHHGFQGQITKF